MVDLGWHIVFLLLSDSSGCAAVFVSVQRLNALHSLARFQKHQQLLYSSAKSLYELLVFFLPTWALLAVFQIHDQPRPEGSSRSLASANAIPLLSAAISYSSQPRLAPQLAVCPRWWWCATGVAATARWVEVLNRPPASSATFIDTDDAHDRQVEQRQVPGPTCHGPHRRRCWPWYAEARRAWPARRSIRFQVPLPFPAIQIFYPRDAKPGKQQLEQLQFEQYLQCALAVQQPRVMLSSKRFALQSFPLQKSFKVSLSFHA